MKRFIPKPQLYALAAGLLSLGAAVMGTTACCSDDGDATICMRFVLDNNACEACQSGTVAFTDFQVDVGGQHKQSSSFSTTPWSICVSVPKKGGSAISAKLVQHCRDAGGQYHTTFCTSDAGIVTPQICDKASNSASVDVHMNCTCYPF